MNLSNSTDSRSSSTSNYNLVQFRTESPTLRNTNLLKLTNSLKLVGFTQQTASELAKKVFEIQQKLTDEKKVELLGKRVVPLKSKNLNKSALVKDASDTLDYKIVIHKNYIFFFNALITDKGTYSQVFEIKLFPTRNFRFRQEDILSPSRPVDMALKKTRQKAPIPSPSNDNGKKKRKNPDFSSYSPEYKKLETATNGQTNGFDVSLDRFKDEEGYGYSVHKLCRGGDLESFSFAKLNNPVIGILKVLIPSLDSLKTMHRYNHIHRDVKSSNILVLTDNDDGEAGASKVLDGKNISGVLSDPGLIKREHSNEHKTTGTCGYLDPADFGSEKETLINQRNRRGLQTKKGDTWAYGIVLYKDILCKFIREKCAGSSVQNEVSTLLDALATRKSKVTYDDDQLRLLGENSNYRLCYIITNGPVNFLFGYPELKVIEKNLTNACTVLKEAGLLEEKEMNGLIRLSKLSCKMQENQATRPTSAKALEEVESILMSLQNEPLFGTDQEKEADTNTHNRKKIRRGLSQEFDEAQKAEKPECPPTLVVECPPTLVDLPEDQKAKTDEDEATLIIEPLLHLKDNVGPAEDIYSLQL